MEPEMGNLIRYRFQPKDEEIISLLNKKKIDPDFYVQTINEVDIYNFEPFDLPRLSAIRSDEFVWYFFYAPYCKHSNGKRGNRRTNTGYWKITGKGRKIFAKHGKEVIGSKKVLFFCEHGDASQKHKAEWIMHEFCSEYNSPRKKDFVICRIERKTSNKPKISTSDDCQSSYHLASKFKNHVAENNFARVETQQLPGHTNITYDFRNHVAENNFPRAEPHSRNHVAENTVEWVEHEELAYMTSNYRNHVAENIFSMEDSQLLPNQHLASNSRNDVAENTYPRDESQLLPSHHLASRFRNHVAENTFHGRNLCFLHNLTFDGCNGLNCNSFPALQLPINVEGFTVSAPNGLDHNSFSAHQSPINPEQRSCFYSEGFSNDCSVVNFQFDSKQEDMSSQLAFQDKYPLEETAHPFLLASTHQNQSPQFILGIAVRHRR